MSGFYGCVDAFGGVGTDAACDAGDGLIVLENLACAGWM